MSEHDTPKPQKDTVVHVDFFRRGKRQASRPVQEAQPSQEPVTETRVAIGGEKPGDIRFGTDPTTGDSVAVIHRDGEEPERRPLQRDVAGKGLSIFNEAVQSTGIDPTAKEVRPLPRHARKPSA